MNSIKYIISCLNTEDTKKCTDVIGSDAEIVMLSEVRSAVYRAIGICEKSNEAVFVLTYADNSSRSAFSGMTEAYYRKLPVVLFTVGSDLDYSRELADVVSGHIVLDTLSDISDISDISYPAHIEIRHENRTAESTVSCNSITKRIAEQLSDRDYLYIGSGVKTDISNAKCKIVHGGICGCYDGAISNLLGASLAKKRNRYVGIITETEFLHDVNTLGNININDSIKIFVICNEKNKGLITYSSDIGFEVSEISKKMICDNDIEKTLKCDRRSLMFVVD